MVRVLRAVEIDGRPRRRRGRPCGRPWLTRSARRVLGSASVTGVGFVGENPLLYGPPSSRPDPSPCPSSLIRWIVALAGIRRPARGPRFARSPARSPAPRPEDRLAWLRDLSAWVRADLGRQRRGARRLAAVRAAEAPAGRARAAARAQGRLRRRRCARPWAGATRSTSSSRRACRARRASWASSSGASSRSCCPSRRPRTSPSSSCRCSPSAGTPTLVPGITTENWQGDPGAARRTARAPRTSASASPRPPAGPSRPRGAGLRGDDALGGATRMRGDSAAAPGGLGPARGGASLRRGVRRGDQGRRDAEGRGAARRHRRARSSRWSRPTRTSTTRA